MRNPNRKPPLARVAAKTKKDKNYLHNLKRDYALRKDVLEIIYSLDKLHDAIKALRTGGAL